ncbi:hypothetical protein ACI2LF_28155 [Kribbella sp. NPDC020789]
MSGVASARGDTGLAIGNIAGSNILNLTLVLGIAAPAAIRRRLGFGPWLTMAVPGC